MEAKTLLINAIKGAVAAGRAITEVYEDKTFEIHRKEDESPLTKADIASNKIINAYLEKTGIPIISEENKQVPYEVRQKWDICWIVDPLDGTKEFIKRNGEFTVNIALVKGGVPIIGVIYVPIGRELFYADCSANKAYKTFLDEELVAEERLFSDKDELFPNENISDNHLIKVVGSRSHMNSDTQEFINGLQRQFDKVEIVSKGSSLKFCMVAEGMAHIYPRFAPTMEWDTAAGHAICKAVGLRVISKETDRELKYNKENLLNSYFVVQN